MNILQIIPENTVAVFENNGETSERDVLLWAIVQDPAYPQYPMIVGLTSLEITGGVIGDGFPESYVVVGSPLEV